MPAGSVARVCAESLDGLWAAALGTRVPHAAWLVTEGSAVLASRDPDRRFASASTIKTFLLLAALEADPDAAGALRVGPRALAGGDGVLKHFSLPRSLARREVLALMTVVSDNTAANAVIAALGGVDACNAQFTAWGMEATRLRGYVDGAGEPAGDREAIGADPGLATPAGLGVTTPAEHAWAVGRLAGRGGLGLELLLAQQDRRSLARRLGDGVRLAHKTGSVGRVRHDGGVLLAGDRTLFVQAFTDGGPEAEWVDHPACVGMGEAMAATVQALGLDAEVLAA